MVVGELLKAYTIGNEKVLHKTVTVVEKDNAVEKLVVTLADNIIRQKAVIELAIQFDNASTAKDDLRKAFEKCNDIPQESRALIDTFLKQESDKDYKMHLAIRAEEKTRVLSLPLDEPFNNYGMHNTRISNILEAAREEVTQSMDEKQELINNYRAT
ncbi:hypothetical protein Tco_1504129 [Tanacetum coccineum]